MDRKKWSSAASLGEEGKNGSREAQIVIPKGGREGRKRERATRANDK